MPEKRCLIGFIANNNSWDCVQSLQEYLEENEAVDVNVFMDKVWENIHQIYVHRKTDAEQRAEAVQAEETAKEEELAAEDEDEERHRDEDDEEEDDHEDDDDIKKVATEIFLFVTKLSAATDECATLQLKNCMHISI